MSFELDLNENEQCFYYQGMESSRPMCLGVSDQAIFFARELFLKIEAYTMQRIPLEDVKEVVLSRERGPRVWIKWSMVLAFGIISMIVMAIGLSLSPNSKPSVFGTAGPLVFVIVGLAMLIDGRWRLVLTIKTETKEYRWRPHIFDKRDEVTDLREGFLAACRYVGIRTRRLDLVNKGEITRFWKWMENHAADIVPKKLPLVRERLHKLCDGLDADIIPHANDDGQQLILTSNYAADAFPIVEELSFAAPTIPGITVTAFKPRRKIGDSYCFSGVEYRLDNIFFLKYTDGFGLAFEIYADWEDFEDSEEFIWSLYRDLLGEYDVVVGVQWVRLRELAEADDPTLLRNIRDLPDAVDEFHYFEVN